MFRAALLQLHALKKGPSLKRALPHLRGHKGSLSPAFRWRCPFLLPPLLDPPLLSYSLRQVVVELKALRFRRKFIQGPSGRSQRCPAHLLPRALQNQNGCPSIPSALSEARNDKTEPQAIKGFSCEFFFFAYHENNLKRL